MVIAADEAVAGSMSPSICPEVRSSHARDAKGKRHSRGMAREPLRACAGLGCCRCK